MSECYFCGITNPTILDKHHVFPSEVATGLLVMEEQKIVLCANGHRKLHALIDPLVQYIKTNNYGGDVPYGKPIKIIMAGKLRRGF